MVEDPFRKHFRRRLQAIGLSDPAIEAAWPDWWSGEAVRSRSAQDELRFSVARNLGLDPRSLLDDNDQAQFIWKDEARFKHLAADDGEVAAIASFGKSLAGLLARATGPARPLPPLSASSVRDAVLASQEVVGLHELLSLCWGIGIPVVHLGVVPLKRKKMHAMALERDGRYAILVARDDKYPPWIAHHIAHELGHIVLGHLATTPVLVDLESEPGDGLGDEQEVAADAFALELLTGEPDALVEARGATASARALAKIALESGPKLRVEPGTLALCYGYSSKNWKVANGALQYVYNQGVRASELVNQVAMSQMDLGSLPSDSGNFLRAVLTQG